MTLNTIYIMQCLSIFGVIGVLFALLYHAFSKRFEKRYRAHYPDGNMSRPMSYFTARNYADIFGGKVIKDESLNAYGYPKE
jgi:hypothetical protein